MNTIDIFLSKSRSTEWILCRGKDHFNEYFHGHTPRYILSFKENIFGVLVEDRDETIMTMRKTNWIEELVPDAIWCITDSGKEGFFKIGNDLDQNGIPKKKHLQIYGIYDTPSDPQP